MNESDPTPNPEGMWTKTQAYALAVLCLLMGAALGFMLRGSVGTGAAPDRGAEQSGGAAGTMGGATAPPQMKPEQLKAMADKQAEPLLAKLKDSPSDANLLASIGNVYYDASLFKEAIRYYEQVLQIKPDETNTRTDLGTAYFSLGDSDRALSEFDQVLRSDPKHANALFNVGIVKWQGKMDIDGAVAAWKRLLEINPDYSQRQKVESLIKQAQQHRTMKPGTMTDKPAQISP